MVVIDSCGSDSILVPDYITVSCTTSIGNLLIPDQFQVYPNPTSNYIYIAAENIENEEYIFSLRDIVGQELTSEKVDVKDNILLKRLDVAQLTSGIYMLSIESNLSKWRIKIYKL
ncbi:MAG: T9SS type A sorting domain-containing protein [Bacteroidetes bacterium]|nr:T9SS type A sorting domain-containing protein [Bacteroidota bacterium]